MKEAYAAKSVVLFFQNKSDINKQANFRNNVNAFQNNSI